MKIQIDIAAIGRSKWHEHLVRFVFGGLVTALAGIIAKRYGPEIGGLFLAFPAIFPATATLLEKHEKQKEMPDGRAVRAREVAGVDAAGAAMGSLGLMAFAVIIWRWLPRYPLVPVLITATLAWLLASVTMWIARKTMWRNLRIKFRKSQGKSEIGREISNNRRSHE